MHKIIKSETEHYTLRLHYNAVLYNAVYAKTFFRPQDNLTYNSKFLPVMANW